MRRIKMEVYEDGECKNEFILNEIYGMEEFIKLLCNLCVNRYYVARAVVAFYRHNEYRIIEGGKMTHRFVLET